MELYLAGPTKSNLSPMFREMAKQISEGGLSKEMDMYLAGFQGKARFIADHADDLQGVTQASSEDDMDLYLAGNATPHRGKGKFIERNAEDLSGVYLAGSAPGTTGDKGKMMTEEADKLLGVSIERVDVAILESFYYCDEYTEALIPKVRKFLLDSGAFTFFSSGKRVDWNDYLNKYIGFIRRNKVERFFELDIDNLVGYEKVLEFRKRLEDGVGKQCIPVWHKSRGKDEFLKMCEEYKYVSIGGIVSGEIKRDQYKLFPWFIREAHRRGAKIHGLGFTNLKGLELYRFDSVDSTAWVSGNRFGHVYRFNGRTMDKVNKPEGKRIGDSLSAAIHNFNEWVKFQRYAEKNL